MIKTDNIINGKDHQTIRQYYPLEALIGACISFVFTIFLKYFHGSLKFRVSGLEFVI